MPSNLIIMIVPNSTRTNDRDVKRLTALLEQVVSKAEGKLYADFKVEVISDMQMIATGLNRECDHTFMLTDGSGRLIAPKKKDLHIRCLKCATDFDLVTTRAEANEALHGAPRGQAALP